MNPIPTLPAGALALLTFAAAAAAQGITGQYHEVVMAVGSPVAAIPGATINPTSNIDSPVIDQNGTMLFRARMVGGGVLSTDDRAYFMGRGAGDMQMILRAGDQAPGLPAGTLLRSTSSAGLNSKPRIRPFGELLFFLSTLTDPINPIPATADSALFWGPVGGFVPLAREGDQVPFLAPGITWGQLSQSHQYSHINGSGLVLFSAPLVGATATTDSVLVTGTPGSLVAVVQEGQTMPGGEVVIPVSGTTLGFTTLINGVGQVLYETRYQVAGSVTALNDRAMVLYTGGSYTTIIREGDQAPGLPAGVVFKDSASFNGWAAGVGSTCFNVLGQALIVARVEDGGTTIGLDEQTLWVGSASGLTLVFRRNDPCPGLPAGVNFATPNSSGAAINDNGTLCFIASLQGAAVTAADDSSYWYGTPGNLMLLAREGDVVPGLAPSGNGPWRYGPVSAGTGSPHLNNRGQVVFQNTLSDGVVQRSVLMSYDSNLGIQLQLDSTDTFTTPNGTAAWTGFSHSGSTSSDGSSAWFNSQGDFIWKPLFNAPLTAAVVHGRVGSLQTSSSYAIKQSLGGQQNFAFDFGTARAGQIYAMIGSASGTRPGTISPIGPQMIPLNWDAWTDISLTFHNTLVYQNTIGFLDANGRGTATFFVPGGFTWDPTLHHAVVSLTLDGFGTPTSTMVTDPIAVRLY